MNIESRSLVLKNGELRILINIFLETEMVKVLQIVMEKTEKILKDELAWIDQPDY